MRDVSCKWLDTGKKTLFIHLNTIERRHSASWAAAAAAAKVSVSTSPADLFTGGCSTLPARCVGSSLRSGEKARGLRTSYWDSSCRLFADTEILLLFVMFSPLALCSINLPDREAADWLSGHQGWVLELHWADFMLLHGTSFIYVRASLLFTPTACWFNTHSLSVDTCSEIYNNPYFWSGIVPIRI